MKKRTFYIIGKHSVEEAIKNPSRKIHKLYITDDAKRKINQAIKNHNLLKNVKIFFRSKKNWIISVEKVISVTKVMSLRLMI